MIIGLCCLAVLTPVIVWVIKTTHKPYANRPGQLDQQTFEQKRVLERKLREIRARRKT